MEESDEEAEEPEPTPEQQARVTAILAAAAALSEINDALVNAVPDVAEPAAPVEPHSDERAFANEVRARLIFLRSGFPVLGDVPETDAIFTNGQTLVTSQVVAHVYHAIRLGRPPVREEVIQTDGVGVYVLALSAYQWFRASAAPAWPIMVAHVGPLRAARMVCEDYFFVLFGSTWGNDENSGGPALPCGCDSCAPEVD